MFYINLPGAQHVDVKAVVFALRELSQPQHPLEQHLNLERIQRGLVRYPKKNSVIERGSIKCNIWKITIFAKYVLPILHKFLEYGTCLWFLWCYAKCKGQFVPDLTKLFIIDTV